jgi:putative transposase
MMSHIFSQRKTNSHRKGPHNVSRIRQQFHALHIQHQRTLPIHRFRIGNTTLAYIGGIARKNKMTPLAIDGTSDHLHALLSLPSMMSFARAVQLIKGGSSKWIHDWFPKYRKFEWQEGYGAFSVSASNVDKTIAYINNQKEHHRKRTFQEEFRALLDKHGIEYELRHLFV